MRYLLLVLILSTTGLALQPAWAAGRSIKDCEKIQAADAYNLCLASFGPVAHEHELKPVPAGAGSGRLFGRHHRHWGYYRHGHAIVRRHGHRQRMEINVGSQD